MTLQSYEFSDSQNGLVKDLAQKMSIVGTITVVLAVIILLGSLLGLFGLAAANTPREAGRVVGSAIGSLLQGVLFLLVGLWTYKAGSSFNLIVTTQGNDIENLMGALGQLRKLYNLQFYALIITLVFVAIVFVLAVVAAIVSKS